VKLPASCRSTGHAAASRLAVAGELESAGLETYALLSIQGSQASTNFRAETSAGPLIVKICDDPGPLEASARAAGLLARASMAYQEVVVSPRATPAGWLSAQRWLPGRPLSLEATSHWDHATARRFGTALGSWLRHLHAIPSPTVDWGQLSHERLTRKLGASVALGCISAGTADAVWRRWDLVRPRVADAPTAFVHRDLIRSNLLETDGSFVSAIDFEQSIFADPLYDLVKLMDDVFTLNTAVAQGFAAGYETNFRADHIQSRLWAVTVLERVSSLPYFHDLGDGSQVAKIRRSLDSLLARPLRVRVAGLS
jgi:aminoglycoside phosphotransferase (APT) family kinase protein